MISTQDIRNRLLTIVAEQLTITVQEITDDSPLEKLGADSVDRIEIIMKIEDAFDIEVNDDEAERLVTFGDVVSYVTSLQKPE